MAPGDSYSIVFVTVPDLQTGRDLARALLEARLAACVNILPEIESHYWWQGQLDKSSELLLIIKTEKARLSDLEQAILSRHPYDTPEILAIPVSEGNPRYLAWLGDSMKL